MIDMEVFEGIDKSYGVGGKWLYYELLSLCEVSGPEERVIFKDLIERLPLDSRAIVQLIYNLPDDLEEYLEQKSRPQMFIRDLVNYLRFYGWPYPRIRKAIKEIREMFLP